jgi:hypothetical protein
MNSLGCSCTDRGLARDSEDPGAQARRLSALALSDDPGCGD